MPDAMMERSDSSIREEKAGSDFQEVSLERNETPGTALGPEIKDGLSPMPSDDPKE